MTKSLSSLLPCIDGELGKVVFKLPTSDKNISAVESETAITAGNFVAWCHSQTLPFATINAPRASFADSILLLELDKPAPLALCQSPKAAQNGTFNGKHLLAVLIQSKLHQSENPRSENFKKEYKKCVVDFPFIFLLVSNADAAVKEHQIAWPYNGNGFFVSQSKLENFYGRLLCNIREEAWDEE